MTKREPVRIGLIGAGAIMRLSHAPTIQRSEDAVISGVYDVDRGRAEALAKDFGVELFTSELAGLVERRDIDAVIVATPNVHHAAGVIAAAERGKHVLCEK